MVYEILLRLLDAFSINNSSINLAIHCIQIAHFEGGQNEWAYSLWVIVSDGFRNVIFIGAVAVGVASESGYGTAGLNVYLAVCIFANKMFKNAS